MKSGGQRGKLFGKWFGKKRKQAPKRNLGLEPLESRLPLATFTVTNFNDAGEGSLRQAILDANTEPGADEIVFAKGGTVKLKSALPAITDDVSITAAKKVTINGMGKTSIFSVTGAGTDAVFSGLSLTRGFSTAAPGQVAGGAAFLIDAPGGVVEILNVKIANMRSTGEEVEGGAISIQSGDVTLDGSSVSKSEAKSSQPGIVGRADGGAIFNADTLTILASKIDQSKATSDPGEASGAAIFNASGGTLNIEASTITKNTALGLAAKGGAIVNEGTASILNTNLTLNKATSTGKGVNGADGQKGTNGADGASFGEDGEDGGNGANGANGGGGTFVFGGGVYNAGHLTITNSTISGNSLKAGDGGKGGKGGDGGDGGKGFKGFKSSGGHVVGKGKDGFAGSGGNGGNGGIGGSALGAGIFTTDTATTISTNNTEKSNKAVAGKGGKGGKGGKIGKGQKGGAVKGIDGANGLSGFATL